MYKQRNGFTLVELLIVIVVIAILASISVVAYNGVQERARLASTASVVDSYVKLIRMHYVEHGSYPVRASDYCLGNAADFPAVSPYSAGICVRYSDGSGPTANSDLMNALASYGSPAGSSLLPSTTAFGDEDWRGIRYYSPNGTVAVLEWAVDAPDSCSRGTDYGEDDYSWCRLRLE